MKDDIKIPVQLQYRFVKVTVCEFVVVISKSLKSLVIGMYRAGLATFHSVITILIFFASQISWYAGATFHFQNSHEECTMPRFLSHSNVRFLRAAHNPKDRTALQLSAEIKVYSNKSILMWQQSWSTSVKLFRRQICPLPSALAKSDHDLIISVQRDYDRFCATRNS